MITLDDVDDTRCRDLDQIDAIAQYEHISEAEATMLGEYLMHIHKGAQKVHQMISDDMRVAMHRDDAAHACDLFRTLQHFVREHPEAARGVA